MNRINPKKLLDSKWTAIEPAGREKHFVITEVEFDDSGTVLCCTIEAVLSRRSLSIAWRDLKDSGRWAQGWK